MFRRGTDPPLAAYVAKLAADKHEEGRELARTAGLPCRPAGAELTLAGRPAALRANLVGTFASRRPPVGRRSWRRLPSASANPMPARGWSWRRWPRFFYPSPRLGGALADAGQFLPLFTYDPALRLGRRMVAFDFRGEQLRRASEPRESSCWLTDEQRRALNGRSRFSLGLSLYER